MEQGVQPYAIKRMMGHKALATTAGYIHVSNQFLSTVKSPLDNLEGNQYLSRYTHRVTISNYRIKSMQDGKVTFIWKDRADENKTKLMTLDVEEFIRRFLLHVLPKGFRKIKYFGFLSPRYKSENIKIIRKLMNDDPKKYAVPEDESLEEMMLRLTGINIRQCPKCDKGRMVPIYELLPKHYDYIVPNNEKENYNTS